MMMDAASLLVLFSFIGLLEANVCPPEEDIWPCKCFPVPRGIGVECSHIRKPEELISPMRALERSKKKVWDLIIKDTSLMVLPDNLFKNVNIEQVTLENMTITSLSGGSQTAFYGLENSLIAITAYMVTFTVGFPFDLLRNLKKLEDIVLDRCDMHGRIPRLPHLPNLSQLEITGSKIEEMPSNAFIDLPQLLVLDLQNNYITDMERSMFPNPANDLAHIDLSKNLLYSLSEDFFENMPNLEYLNLEKNKFKFISEKPFSDAFKNGKLVEFDISGNPLHCDCTLSWLGGIRFPKFFTGTCSSPEAYHGKSVRTLDFESLRLEICYAK